MRIETNMDVVTGVDRKLIAKAQAKAGRQIHNVAGLVQAYLLAVKLAEKEPERAEWRIMADAKESALRKFVATGQLEDY